MWKKWNELSGDRKAFWLAMAAVLAAMLLLQ